LWRKAGRNLSDAVNQRDKYALTKRLGQLNLFQGGNVTSLNEFRQARLQRIIIFALGTSLPADGNNRNDYD
jgi:hypothetical protein